MVLGFRLSLSFYILAQRARLTNAQQTEPSHLSYERIRKGCFVRFWCAALTARLQDDPKLSEPELRTSPAASSARACKLHQLQHEHSSKPIESGPDKELTLPAGHLERGNKRKETQAKSRAPDSWFRCNIHGVLWLHRNSLRCMTSLSC